MSEPVNEAAELLSPRPFHRKMVVAVTGGLALLALLGWAATSIDTNRPAPKDLNFDIFAAENSKVKEVIVQVGQHVNKGDVIVALDDADLQQDLADARAELDLVAQNAGDAGVAVAMPPGTGIGGRIVTVGPMPSPSASAPIPLPPAKGSKALLPAVTGTPGASVGTTQPSPKAAAVAHVSEVSKDLEQARVIVIELDQKKETALADANEAQRNAEAGKSIADQRSKAAEKMRSLLREGVVSQVETSRAEAMYASSQGAYEAAKKEADDLSAIAADLGVQAEAAKSRVTKLEKDLAAAQKAADEAKDPPPIVQTPAVAPDVRIPSASGPRKFAYVDTKAPAANVPAKVEVDKTAKTVEDGKLAAAKAKVDQAEKRLGTRKITAAKSGVIVKILVKAGDALKPGQSIAVIKYD